MAGPPSVSPLPLAGRPNPCPDYVLVAVPAPIDISRIRFNDAVILGLKNMSATSFGRASSAFNHLSCVPFAPLDWTRPPLTNRPHCRVSSRLDATIKKYVDYHVLRYSLPIRNTIERRVNIVRDVCNSVPSTSLPSAFHELRDRKSNV